MATEYDIDLEQFPESEAAKRMLSRVSPIYYKSYVGKWLFEVMGREWDEARALIESLRDQCYLERTTWGIRYWEERYGITPDETLDLETRRAACHRAGERYGAISPAKLEDMLAALTGQSVHITEDNSHYCFDVEFEESDEVLDYTAIIEKLNSTKPSHLSYRIVLPRLARLGLYFGVAVHQVKTITWTVCAESGLADLNWLTDENGDALLDEDNNVLLDAE